MRYRFEELSKDAQYSAIAKLQPADLSYAVDMIKELACVIGLYIKDPVNYDIDGPRSYFVFDGYYSYEKGWEKRYRERYPVDRDTIITDIYKMYKRFVVDYERPAFYKLSCTLMPVSTYRRWKVIVQEEDTYNWTTQQIAGVTAFINVFCEFAVKIITDEYESQTSPDTLKQFCYANDFWFTEDGCLL